MNWINFLGLTAAALATSSFLPQVIKVIKTKHTRDISLWMFILSATGISLWFIYGILIKNTALIFGNSIGLILSGIILCYKIRYK